MIITNKKIEVSEQMLFNEGLSRFYITNQIGVPHDSFEKEPVTWIHFTKLTDEDFDLIEAYFLHHKFIQTNG